MGCYEAPVLLPDDLKFRVQSLEFGVDMELHRGEVRRRVSRCWLQFVHCTYLLLWSRYFVHRFGVWE